MTTDRLTDKERALIEAAKREAASRRAGPSGGAKAPAAQPASAKAPASPRSSTPLEQPTVLGWDHPAANPKPATKPLDQRTLASGDTGGATVSGTTPLDQPTVLGWDNPAAQQDPATAKWERISQLMAAERETAEAQRRKVKKYGLIVSAVLFAAGMMVVMALWPRPGA
jgi:hypothetical protein